MPLASVAVTIGKAMLSAAAPAAIQAAAAKIRAMPANKQMGHITDAFSAAAAANELVAQLKDLADPEMSFALREAMVRHQASLSVEKEKIDALLRETLAARSAGGADA